MDYEKEIAILRQEIEELKSRKPKIINTTFYKIADQECDEFFERVKQENQNYSGRLLCKNAAKDAYCERHNLFGKDRKTPSRYITSEESAKEFVALFKLFLAIYQGYLKNGVRFNAS